MIAMANNKILMLSLTVIALTITVAVVMEGSTHDPSSVGKVSPTEYSYISDLDITVLCPSNEEKVISFLNSHSIPYTVSHDHISDSEMVVLTERWVEQNLDTYLEDYVNMAEQGSILVAVDTTIDYEKTGLTMSYSDIAEVNVYWMKTNQIRCNSPYLEDTYKSLSFAFDWIEKRLYEDYLYSGYDGELGTEIEFVGTYSSNGYGNSVIQTY